MKNQRILLFLCWFISLTIQQPIPITIQLEANLTANSVSSIVGLASWPLGPCVIRGETYTIISCHNGLLSMVVDSLSLMLQSSNFIFSQTVTGTPWQYPQSIFVTRNNLNFAKSIKTAKLFSMDEQSFSNTDAQLNQFYEASLAQPSANEMAFDENSNALQNQTIMQNIHLLRNAIVQYIYDSHISLVESVVNNQTQVTVYDINNPSTWLAQINTQLGYPQWEVSLLADGIYEIFYTSILNSQSVLVKTTVYLSNATSQASVVTDTRPTNWTTCSQGQLAPIEITQNYVIINCDLELYVFNRTNLILLVSIAFPAQGKTTSIEQGPNQLQIFGAQNQQLYLADLILIQTPNSTFFVYDINTEFTTIVQSTSGSFSIQRMAESFLAITPSSNTSAYYSTEVCSYNRDTNSTDVFIDNIYMNEYSINNTYCSPCTGQNQFSLWQFQPSCFNCSDYANQSSISSAYLQGKIMQACGFSDWQIDPTKWLLSNGLNQSPAANASQQNNSSQQQGVWTGIVNGTIVVSGQPLNQSTTNNSTYSQPQPSYNQNQSETIVPLVVVNQGGNQYTNITTYNQTEQNSGFDLVGFLSSFIPVILLLIAVIGIRVYIVYKRNQRERVGIASGNQNNQASPQRPSPNRIAIRPDNTGIMFDSVDPNNPQRQLAEEDSGNPLQDSMQQRINMIVQSLGPDMEQNQYSSNQTEINGNNNMFRFNNEINNAPHLQPLDFIFSMNIVPIIRSRDRAINLVESETETHEYWVVKSKFDQIVCAICAEDFGEHVQVRKTHCSHLFHSRCIVKWVQTHFRNQRTAARKQDPFCPVCRQPLEKEKKQ